MDDLSSFLFARPSFFEGAGRLVDFGDTLDEYNYSDSPGQADATAFLADLTSVARDIQEASQAGSVEKIAKR